MFELDLLAVLLLVVISSVLHNHLDSVVSGLIVNWPASSSRFKSLCASFVPSVRLKLKLKFVQVRIPPLCCFKLRFTYTLTGCLPENSKSALLNFVPLSVH